MKVIMRKDVGGVGQRGSIQEVSDGYALNYLIPNGLAEQATPAKIAEHEKRQREAAQTNAAREKEWATQAERLNGATIAVLARANEQGHLYNQLPAELIRSEIKKLFGIEVPPDAIIISAPIKTLGEEKIQIRMGLSTAMLKLIVKGA